MKPIQTARTTYRFVLPGGTSANDLWVERCVDHANDSTVLASVWKPTPEERQQIADGANIELLVWGGQPPVAMKINTDDEVL
jgi:hypothetical protein